MDCGREAPRKGGHTPQVARGVATGAHSNLTAISRTGTSLDTCSIRFSSDSAIEFSSNLLAGGTRADNCRKAAPCRAARRAP